MISVGGTTLNAGEYQLLTQKDLASILAPAKLFQLSPGQPVRSLSR
jgi:hypothetical protein